ncbi:hypothetical protein [Mameliella alba]|uniref:hypothetical protein n=1 Tax=Mameliella alba TaxID=561184 RepID=UPI000B5324C7|nr:hypothetical protein [Mameliella alba]OWV40373.1 hypothetical protein CDZ95_21335 [Mameliella alba]
MDCRDLVAVITWASIRAAWLGTGLRAPLCAIAWELRALPGWRAWVWCADRALAWFETDHCRRSAGRHFPQE